MENNNRPNYKIYFFKNKDYYAKEVIERFYAENDAAAYAHLEEMRNACSDGKQLYYGSIHYVCSVDANGKHSEFDMDDRDGLCKWIHADDTFLKRIWENIKDFFEWWFVDKPRDLMYWMKDLVYLLKNKEARSNQWNLDWHLIESIERNVPSLIENSYALAFIDEAIVQMHSNEPGFDLDKFHKENCSGYPKEIEDLAIKIQKEEYEKLLLHVKLYKYYADFGVVDFSNPDEVAFDKQWRHTLPIKIGTYDEISDYNKLIDMTQEQWREIWDWVKKYGQRLND